MHCFSNLSRKRRDITIFTFFQASIPISQKTQSASIIKREHINFCGVLGKNACYCCANQTSYEYILFLMFLHRALSYKRKIQTNKMHNFYINPLNTKRRLLYLKTQFVPRSKHFSSRL